MPTAPRRAPSGSRPLDTSRYYIILTIFLLIGLITPVLAADYPITGTLDYNDPTSYTYNTIGSANPTGDSYYTPYLYIGNVEKLQDPKILFTDRMPVNSVMNPAVNTSGSAPCTLGAYGTGTMYYNIHFIDNVPAKLYWWIEFDSWDCPLTGRIRVAVDYDPEDIHGLSLYTTKPSQSYGSGIDTNEAWMAFSLSNKNTGNPSGFYHGSYTLYSSAECHHTYTVNDEGNKFVVNVDKMGYYSDVTINDDATNYYQDINTNEPINIDVYKQFSEGTLVLNVTDTYGNIYLRNLGGEGPTPTPNNASVTIYIKNSQTGALLSDAHIEIQDTTPDPWTEVINQTIPSGQVAISLPKDSGIHFTQYHIGATVPGYQQVVPALFFRVTGPTNVVVEMEPLTGAPADENNSFVAFYVRDISANAIANAKVLVDGKMRWTNAQGYSQFEVAKNASHPYSVSKSGYVTIEGTATVADGPRYVVNVVLGPGTVPTNPPATDPGGPGATPTPDTRTNEQKGQAIIDLIADFAEPIAILAILATIFGLLKMMTPGRR